MKIFDYQSGKELSDVSVILTEEELKDLAAYVQKLHHDSHVSCAHLSDYSGSSVRSELTFAIGPRMGYTM